MLRTSVLPGRLLPLKERKGPGFLKKHATKLRRVVDLGEVDNAGGEVIDFDTYLKTRPVEALDLTAAPVAVVAGEKPSFLRQQLFVAVVVAASVLGIILSASQF